jgi:hypothetical protein
MIFADFNNRDVDGFLRLNTVGTINDLELKSIALHDGLRLSVSDGDLVAETIIRSPGIEGVWRGEIVGTPT